MKPRQRKQKSGLIEKHGQCYVINAKWALRGLGLFLFATSLITLLAAAFRPLPGVAIHSSAYGISSAVTLMIVAEFCDS